MCDLTMQMCYLTVQICNLTMQMCYLTMQMCYLTMQMCYLTMQMINVCWDTSSLNQSFLTKKKKKIQITMVPHLRYIMYHKLCRPLEDWNANFLHTWSQEFLIHLKFWARHHQNLKFGSKMKYLNIDQQLLS